MIRPRQIGPMRHKVVIEKLPDTDTQATSGEVSSSFEELSTVHAAIRPMSGKEKERAQHLDAKVTHKITLRFLDDVTPKMRILFGTRVFNIIDTLNIDERGRYLELTCQEDV